MNVNKLLNIHYTKLIKKKKKEKKVNANSMCVNVLMVIIS